MPAYVIELSYLPHRFLFHPVYDTHCNAQEFLSYQHIIFLSGPGSSVKTGNQLFLGITTLPVTYDFSSTFSTNKSGCHLHV